MTQDFRDKKNIYFLGIGGIGMSALARLFAHQGKNVAGYDKTPTPLTESLISEGISIHYDDAITNIPQAFLQEKSETLVIYTPAIPADHNEYNFFKTQNYEIIKRAKALGAVSSAYDTIAVAGTHGKTTTSTLIAHLLTQSSKSTNAILGGISANYQSNLVLGDNTNLFVTEADEYDRSFLQLKPHTAIITSIDPDHLDIYGSHAVMKQNFLEFATLCTDTLLLHHSVFQHFESISGVKKISYGQQGDYRAENIRVEDGDFYFDLLFFGNYWKNIRCGVAGIHNVENTVAAIAAVVNLGLTEEEIRAGVLSFKGVKRRFEYIIKKKELVYIDDYAHHPTELEACIGSVRKLYPGKRILGIFQPHLYSRTRDFAQEFAQSLNLLDELVLMEIYPARELPIEGVDSGIIFKDIHIPKTRCGKSELMNVLKDKKFDVLLTLGAGDIDKFIMPIKNYLEH